MTMTMTLPLLALQSGAVAGALACALIGVVGVLVALWGRSFIARDRAIGRWPKAPGTITSSRYESETGTTRDAEGYDVTSTTFTPVVAYRYTVQGREYDGSKVARVAERTGDAKRVKACIDRYPPGARVEVLYDPADPATAYLETRTSGGAVFLMAFGGFFALMGFGMFGLVVATAR